MLTLLNFNFMELELFNGPEDAPNYAILSHTWGTGPDDEPEVLFQDWTDEHLRNKILAGMADPEAPRNWDRKKKGRKLLGFCKMAKEFGHEYGWIDTLCIDKRVGGIIQVLSRIWLT